jgi:hypothetical protein
MPTRQPRVEIFLERMELAVARDAFLWGAPEPCLLAACYQLDSEQAVALGRAIYRVKFEGQSPCELKFGKRLLDLPVRADTFPARLCLLVCAIEENGGRDVQFVYRQLGAPEQLFLWKTTDREPEVQRLIDADRVVSVNRAASVNLLCDGSPLADSFSDDTWVGAACALVEFPAPDEERELNFDTSSEDSRNDWTSVWSLRFA